MAKRKLSQKQLAALARGRAKRRRQLGLADLSSAKKLAKRGVSSGKQNLKQIGYLALGALGGNVANRLASGTLAPMLTDNTTIHKAAGHLSSAALAFVALGKNQQNIGLGAAAATMSNVAGDVLVSVFPS